MSRRPLSQKCRRMLAAIVAYTDENGVGPRPEAIVAGGRATLSDYDAMITLADRRLITVTRGRLFPRAAARLVLGIPPRVA